MTYTRRRKPARPHPGWVFYAIIVGAASMAIAAALLGSASQRSGAHIYEPVPDWPDARDSGEEEWSGR